MSVYSINCNSYTSTKGFRKSDATLVAFTKVTANTAKTSSDLFIEVNNQAIYLPANTAITIPASPTIGSDYAIWATPTGTLEATTDFTSPPATNSRKIGGFHYAPGGNATGTSGGSTTPGINEYSFWDLKFRPVCKDPRGMSLIADNFWCDIYLTGVDAITNGSSKYNVEIADGSSPPKIPVMFGGTGSSTYGSYTWFQAQELAMYFGKRSMTQQEFMAAMYGTTEENSNGTDPVSTSLIAKYTSKWGIIQSTGCLWIWGRNRGGPTSNTNTGGRGAETTMSNASRFGGSWSDGSYSGSRCSGWYSAASYSTYGIGSRFACDHLILD